MYVYLYVFFHLCDLSDILSHLRVFFNFPSNLGGTSGFSDRKKPVFWVSSSCIILDGQLSALGSFVSPIVGPTNGT